VRLAVHALVEHAALPWKERARRWNGEHPEWPYSEANYRRDALDTRNRLRHGTRQGRHQRAENPCRLHQCPLAG